MQTPQNASSVLECDVCYEDYNTKDKKPRILSTCGHSFCTTCLQGIIKGKSVKCPTCRQETSLQDGDVSKLPTDFTALKLLDTLCLECKTLPWVCKCESCAKRMCERCQRRHGKNQELVTALRNLEATILEVENRSRRAVENNMDKIAFKNDVLTNHITKFHQQLSEMDLPPEMKSVLQEQKAVMVSEPSKMLNRNKETMETWSRHVSSQLTPARRFAQEVGTLVKSRHCQHPISKRKTSSLLKNCEQLNTDLNKMDDKSIINHAELLTLDLNKFDGKSIMNHAEMLTAKPCIKMSSLFSKVFEILDLFSKIILVIWIIGFLLEISDTVALTIIIVVRHTGRWMSRSYSLPILR